MLKFTFLLERPQKYKNVGQNPFPILLLDVNKRTVGNENKKDNNRSLEDFDFISFYDKNSNWKSDNIQNS